MEQSPAELPEISGAVLTTERLVLRGIVGDDAAFILGLLNEPAWLRYIGDKGFIETAREHWTYNTGAGPVTEKSQYDITVDALREFVNRVTEGKPENAGVRAAESMR